MEYSNIYGAYNILVWFAKKYPELYINDDTKETVLHYAAAQVSVLLSEYIVKLRQGSGKDRQGMAVKAKGLKA